MTSAPVNRLYRSRDDRVLAGVAAGIADYLGVDAAFVRLAFVALSFAGGAGLLAYILCWALVPEAPEGVHPAPAERPQPRTLVAIGLLLLGLLFLVRGVGLWPGDSLVWPALLAAGGLALVWNRSGERERASALAFLRRLPRKGLRAGALERSGRAALVRTVGGAVLFALGISLFLATSHAGEAARRGVVALLIVVAGVALTFLPWWRRLALELAQERRERVRSQERAELAAHLHDSVLQTLALIQRQEDSESMARLARRQERELRAWLYGGGAAPDPATVVAGLERARSDIEDQYGVRIELVSVGDAPLDEEVEALVKAAREAMANAARLSGAAEIAVYVEVEDDRVAVFVRDRGCGFDLDAVPLDRKGIAESIIGRMHRHGGVAVIRSSPGEGTEVELSLPLDTRAAEPVAAGDPRPSQR